MTAQFWRSRSEASRDLEDPQLTMKTAYREGLSYKFMPEFVLNVCITISVCACIDEYICISLKSSLPSTYFYSASNGRARTQSFTSLMRVWVKVRNVVADKPYGARVL